MSFSSSSGSVTELEASSSSESSSSSSSSSSKVVSYSTLPVLPSDGIRRWKEGCIGLEGTETRFVFRETIGDVGVAGMEPPSVVLPKSDVVGVSSMAFDVLGEDSSSL
jgi:hypothetical protein